jgi:Flp pilus assembly pilin Flp
MKTARLSKLLQSYRAAETGVSAIEYALIAAAMGVATAAGVSVLGPTVVSIFELVASSFSS